MIKAREEWLVLAELQCEWGTQNARNARIYHFLKRFKIPMSPVAFKVTWGKWRRIHMSNNQELANLLADILDDSKPLPVIQQAAEMASAAAAMGASDQQSTEILLREANAVDDFMSEYLGEIQSQVTQLCDTVKAGPNQNGFVKPTTPHELTEQGVDVGIAALQMGADGMTAAEIATAESARETAPMQVFADQSEQVIPLVFPKFEVADFAAAADMRNFATLVTLNTARWHAKVKDRVASQSAATTAGADKNAFETRKNLLVGVDASLKKVHRAIDDARAKHYEMTVPFTTTSIDDTGRRTGGRLLPNTLFDEYITIMAAHQKAMKDALNEFIPVYPQLIQEAQAKLGDRFVPSEYPNPSSIRTKFNLSFDFSPIPAGDDFKGLAATQLSALARKLNQSLELQLGNAMEDLWARMHEAVGKMAERLSSPDKTFHNTLVQNVRDVARLAGHLNMIGDPKVEEIRKLMETHLCQHEPKDLREKPLLRQQTAAHAQDILQRMSR